MITDLLDGDEGTTYDGMEEMMRLCPSLCDSYFNLRAKSADIETAVADMWRKIDSVSVKTESESHSAISTYSLVAQTRTHRMYMSRRTQAVCVQTLG